METSSPNRCQGNTNLRRAGFRQIRAAALEGAGAGGLEDPEVPPC